MNGGELYTEGCRSMAVKTRVTKGKCTARIEGTLTIYSVAQDTEKLLAPLTRCQRMDLDLSGITEFDSAGFQALSLLKRTAQEADINLDVKNCSTTVQDVLDIYGMSDQLEAVSALTDDRNGSGGTTS